MNVDCLGLGTQAKKTENWTIKKLVSVVTIPTSNGTDVVSSNSHVPYFNCEQGLDELGLVKISQIPLPKTPIPTKPTCL
jgi:hypothetical protein